MIVEHSIVELVVLMALSGCIAFMGGYVAGALWRRK